MQIKSIRIRKKQKGVTLIDTIVAIAVFSIISLALFSSVVAMQKVVTRQEEYVKLEMLCHDISEYSERYPNDWYEIYFGEEAESSQLAYLTNDFKPTNEEEDARYIIEFSSDIIKSIRSKDGENTFVENVKLPIKEEVN